MKSRRRIVVSRIAISASPCLPPEKLTQGLSRPIAPLALQSPIAFSRLALCTEALPYANFGSWRFSLRRVSATDSTPLSAVQSCQARWYLKHARRLTFLLAWSSADLWALLSLFPLAKWSTPVARAGVLPRELLVVRNTLNSFICFYRVLPNARYYYFSITFTYY